MLWAAEKRGIERFVTEGRLTRQVVHRFVAGEGLDEAIAAIKQLNQKGIGGILDLLGEGVVDPAGADAAEKDYFKAIDCVEQNAIDTTVALKLTQLGLVLDKSECVHRLRRLAEEARSIGASIEIDMEQSDYVSDTLEVYRAIRQDFDDVRLAIQAYLRRTPTDLEALADLHPKIRLVKGAYAERESVAFQKRSEIDAQYMYLTDWLFEHGTDPGIATHDSKLLEHAKEASARAGGQRCFEIQMLYGVRRELQHELARLGYRVRVYVPFGSAWYPYLMRRLAERPANLRFFARAVLRG